MFFSNYQKKKKKRKKKKAQQHARAYPNFVVSKMDQVFRSELVAYTMVKCGSNGLPTSIAMTYIQVPLITPRSTESQEKGEKEGNERKKRKKKRTTREE